MYCNHSTESLKSFKRRDVTKVIIKNLPKKMDDVFIIIYTTVSKKSIPKLVDIARKLTGSEYCKKQPKSSLCTAISEALALNLVDQVRPENKAATAEQLLSQLRTEDIEEYVDDMCNKLSSKQSCESKMSASNEGELLRDCRWHMQNRKCEYLQSLDLRRRATYQVGGSATVDRYKAPPRSSLAAASAAASARPVYDRPARERCNRYNQNEACSNDAGCLWDDLRLTNKCYPLYSDKDKDISSSKERCPRIKIAEDCSDQSDCIWNRASNDCQGI